MTRLLLAAAICLCLTGCGGKADPKLDDLLTRAAHGNCAAIASAMHARGWVGVPADAATWGRYRTEFLADLDASIRESEGE